MKTWICVVSAVAACGAAAWMAPRAQGAGGAAHKFVGTSGCASSACHGGGKTGNEMKKWANEDPHAKAFDQLGEEKAAKIGAAIGAASPQEDKKCLGCHSTAGDAADDLKKAVAAEDGVSCEGCHGAGASYKDDKHFKDRAFALANGLVDLKNADQRKSTCNRCHGKIDEKMVAAGHPKATKYEEREAAYKKFAHWKQ